MSSALLATQCESNLIKERDGWMLLMMGSWLYVKSTGARNSTPSTVSFTGCSEGSACGGVLQVSMVADRLMDAMGRLVYTVDFHRFE